MLPIFWLPAARDDLRQIVSYIAQNNPTAARRMKKRLEDAVLSIADHPYLYRVSERVPGTREIVAHPNYAILYRVAATSANVVAVVHTSLHFPQEG